MPTDADDIPARPVLVGIMATFEGERWLHLHRFRVARSGRVLGGALDTLGGDQGSPFRFYCSEFCFFDQSLTFILLNLKPKLQTFRTEIRIPVFTENEKNHRNFGLSDRKGEPWCQLPSHNPKI